MKTLSEKEYEWWQEKFSEFLGEKATGIQLYKHEIGYKGKYYPKSEVASEECPVEVEVFI